MIAANFGKLISLNNINKGLRMTTWMRLTSLVFILSTQVVASDIELVSDINKASHIKRAMHLHGDSFYFSYPAYGKGSNSFVDRAFKFDLSDGHSELVELFTGEDGLFIDPTPYLFDEDRVFKTRGLTYSSLYQSVENGFIYRISGYRDQPFEDWGGISRINIDTGSHEVLHLFDDESGGFLFMTETLAVNGKIYFNGCKRAVTCDQSFSTDLFSYDVIENTITQIDFQSSDTQYVSSLTLLKNKIYFSDGQALWELDSSTKEETVRKVTKSDGLSPEGLVVLNDKLYFWADGEEGRAIVAYDPANGRITELPFSTDIGGRSPTLIPVNDKLIFSTTGGVSPPHQMWVLDVNTKQYSHVFDINQGSIFGDYLTLEVVGSRVYFPHDDGTSGTELYFYDSESKEVSLVTDLRVGPENAFREKSSSDRVIYGYNGEIYFYASDGQSGEELWRYDPVNKEIIQVTKGYDENDGSNPREMFLYQEKLIALVNYEDDTTLWMFDKETQENKILTYSDTGKIVSVNSYNPIFRGDKLYVRTFEGAFEVDMATFTISSDSTEMYTETYEFDDELYVFNYRPTSQTALATLSRLDEETNTLQKIYFGAEGESELTARNIAVGKDALIFSVVVNSNEDLYTPRRTTKYYRLNKGASVPVLFYSIENEGVVSRSRITYRGSNFVILVFETPIDTGDIYNPDSIYEYSLYNITTNSITELELGDGIKSISTGLNRKTGEVGHIFLYGAYYDDDTYRQRYIDLRDMQDRPIDTLIPETDVNSVNVLEIINSEIFFAVERNSGKTIWKYDVETEEAKQLGAEKLGLISEITEYQNSLYFYATYPNQAYEGDIFRYNHVSEILERVPAFKDGIARITEILEPFVIDGVLYFQAKNENEGYLSSMQLWAYEESSESLWRLSDNIRADSTRYINNSAIIYGERIYLALEFDGVGVELGRIKPKSEWAQPVYTGGHNATAVAFDYDGDGIADIAVRRPSSGMQFVKRSGDGGITRLFFGSSDTDIPVSGDFDGDNIADIAVYRAGLGQWLIKRSSDGTIDRVIFGNQSGDIPVPADYDGDGITDIAIRRASTGQWLIRQSSSPSNIQRIFFGANVDDIPVPADYDGDGVDDIAIRRPSTGHWVYRLSSSNSIVRTYFGGEASDIPLPGDYDGDGVADLAVRRPGSGFWFIRYSSDSSIFRIFFGSMKDDIPMPADYDGDGRDDLAFRRSSTGQNIVAESGSNYVFSRLFFGSQKEDIPLAAPVFYRMEMAGVYSDINYLTGASSLINFALLFNADSKQKLRNETAQPFTNSSSLTDYPEFEKINPSEFEVGQPEVLEIESEFY